MIEPRPSMSCLTLEAVPEACDEGSGEVNGGLAFRRVRERDE